jgi:hypothetical protein
MEWKGNYRFEARNEKGLSVSFDAPIPHGGEETALSPMENVLASLAACSSFHALTITKKEEAESFWLLRRSGSRKKRIPTTKSLHENPSQIYSQRRKHCYRSG